MFSELLARKKPVLSDTELGSRLDFFKKLPNYVGFSPLPKETTSPGECRLALVDYWKRVDQFLAA